MSEKIHDVVERHFKELRERSNVLNVAVGTKIVKGADTGQPCITVYVKEKKPQQSLSTKDIIPPAVENVVTDVVELKADYELGDTDVSKRPPYIQRRMAAGVRKHAKRPA